MSFYVYSDFFFFKHKTAYEMRISDWSSDVCSSDLSRIAKAKLGIGRALLAQQREDGDIHARDEVLKHRPARRRLEIFDDMRLDTGIADQAQGVARCAAIGIVIADDVHDRPHATSGSGKVAPSLRPTSRSLVPSAALSRLAIGRAVQTAIRLERKIKRLKRSQ